MDTSPVMRITLVSSPERADTSDTSQVRRSTPVSSPEWADTSDTFWVESTGLPQPTLVK